MTSSEDPDQIRRQIEGTQRELSVDVDRLSEKVNPSRVVERRVERARGAVTSVKDKIMGSSPAASHRSTGPSVGDRTSSAASSAADAVSGAPQAMRQQAQGNPLAAGLIAFGAGWLVASLLPASQKEQEIATQAKDAAREHSSAITGPLTDVANQVKENLREPAQQAAEAVRSTATDAASTVQDEARSAAQDVSGRAQEAKDSVKEQQQSSGSSSSDYSSPQHSSTEPSSYPPSTSPSTSSSGYERPYGTP